MRRCSRSRRAATCKKLVLAVPVAPSENIVAMHEEADEVICLEDHEFFGAIGFYYRDFRQISDEEVIEMLKRFLPKPKERETQLPAA